MNKFLQALSACFRKVWSFSREAEPIVLDLAKIAEPVVALEAPEVVPVYNAVLTTAESLDTKQQ